MAAPMIIKSNTDSGDKDGGGSFWQIDFTTLDEVEEDETANLDHVPLSTMAAENALVFDYNGMGRKGSFAGSRVDGDTNGAGAMTNAAWILLIRGKMTGRQNLLGPYRLVKSSSPTSYYPQETKYIYINRFKWRYKTKGINVIEYNVDYIIGA